MCQNKKKQEGRKYTYPNWYKLIQIFDTNKHGHKTTYLCANILHNYWTVQESVDSIKFVFISISAWKLLWNLDMHITKLCCYINLKKNWILYFFIIYFQILLWIELINNVEKLDLLLRQFPLIQCSRYHSPLDQIATRYFIWGINVQSDSLNYECSVSAQFVCVLISILIHVSERLVSL